MNNRSLIFESTKIIEDHLKKPLSVKELSDKVGYSLYHFIRLFSGVIGCSPGEYISSRRLSKAAQDILKNDEKVIDIALSYQFSSSEAFSRAFKKHTGFSPTKFRKDGRIIDDLSGLPWITPYYQDVTSPSGKEVTREPEVVELDELFLAGRIIEVGNDYSPIGKLWSDFIELSPPVSCKYPLEYAQCSFWDPERNDYHLYVMAALQVNKMDQYNTFIYKKVPPARYLRFPHYGPCHTVSETYYWLFSSWLPEKNHKLTLPYNLEMYPAGDSEEVKKGISAWILLPLEEIR